LRRILRGAVCESLRKKLIRITFCAASPDPASGRGHCALRTWLRIECARSRDRTVIQIRNGITDTDPPEPSRRRRPLLESDF